jgi:hypothetical protein
MKNAPPRQLELKLLDEATLTTSPDNEQSCVQCGNCVPRLLFCQNCLRFLGEDEENLLSN